MSELIAPEAETTQLPPGFTWRAPTLDDVPNAVAMFNAVSMDLVGTQQFVEAEFAADWQEPGFDLATDARVIEDAAGQIVGSVDAVCPAPHVRNFIWARVHPAYRGRGLGSLMLAWAEARLRERLSEAPADGRVTVGCQTVAGHQAAADLLTDHGFTHTRSFYSMKIEMDSAPPRPQWPAGITVRTMVPGQDEETLFRTKEEAFRDHWGHVETPFAEAFGLWMHHLQHNPHHDPTLFFLATIQTATGEEIAGYALCEPTMTDFPDMAWVGSLGVRRPWRRQGLALALLHHTFGEFYRRGIKKVGLGVDAGSLTGATRLYERAGMHVFRQTDIYEKELRAGRDLTTQVAEA